MENTQETNTSLQTQENPENVIIDNQATFDENPLSVFSELSKLHGIEVDMEDLTSFDIPSLAKREERVFEKGKTKAFEELKESNPRIAALLEYERNGGDIFKFLENQDIKGVSEVSDGESAKKVITKYLKEVAGLDSEEIEANIGFLADRGESELIKKANSFVKKLDERKEQVFNAELEKQKEYKKFLDEDLKETSSSIANIIKEGLLEDISLPKEDREGFLNYIAPMIEQTWDGKYYIIKEVNPKSKDMITELKAQYLAYKKGALSRLVQTKANNVLLDKLIKNNQTTNNNNNAGGDDKSLLDKIFNR